MEMSLLTSWDPGICQRIRLKKSGEKVLSGLHRYPGKVTGEISLQMNFSISSFCFWS